jgi:hypothetical protein
VNRSRLAALSAGAMFLVASVLVPATALAAGSGTLSVSPTSVSTSTGSTFFVDINSQATTALSGASTGVDFDKTKLQIISVAMGTGWNTAGVSWVLPTAPTIATANTTGHLPAIAAYFTDGTSSLPANTNEVLARVTFFATATGSASPISLTTSGPDTAALIDGAAASYGTPVATTATGGAVTITASANPNSAITTNITGSVDAGFVALTCPTSVNVPLVRNVVNLQDFTCQVGSNVTWTLSTMDNNPDANHGHMVDASQSPVAHLADSLHVRYAANDVDLSSPSLAALATGQNNIALPLTFAQNVRASDKPGAYGMSVLFSITSTF